MDDLIKRQDAINAYCEHECGIKGMTRENCGCDDCGTIFDDIPSAQPQYIARDIATIIENEKDMRVVLKQPRWIPCSERLPEDGTYIVCLDDRSVFEYDYISKWWDEGAWQYCGKDVVAWMPLPEPWKGGQDE